MKRKFALIYLALLIITSQIMAFASPKTELKIFPAPKGVKTTDVYRVSVNGKAVPVYPVKVGAADNDRRFKAVDDLLHSEDYFDTAAFAYFDMSGSHSVEVSVHEIIKTAKILPAALGIKPRISGNKLLFDIASARNLTLEINGNVVTSLHLFINPIERNPPLPGDTNVIYFGPGLHHVSGMIIPDNKTVYVAGGAVVMAGVGPAERYGIEPSGLKNYAPAFWLKGKHIRFRGHGIIDGSPAPTHARNFIMVNGEDIKVQDVIVLNSSGWTIPLRQSKNVAVTNVKIIGYRANSDGIDICNSENVLIENCFIRTNDDLIVVKTQAAEGPVKHVIVTGCVLWNQLANALSIGAEIRENVADVLFSNCDIIHDYSRAWCLRVFHSDAAKVSNITFRNIRIEESHQLISLWIGKDIASHDKGTGTISAVTFENIRAAGAPLNIDIVGANSASIIENVVFKNVLLNGKPLTQETVKRNPFTSKISVLN